MKSLNNLRNTINTQEFRKSRQHCSTLMKKLLALETSYPVISRCHHNDMKALIRSAADMSDQIDVLANIERLKVYSKTSDELEAELQSCLLAIETGVRSITSQLKERVKTTNFVILGSIWGEYIPLRFAIP